MRLAAIFSGGKDSTYAIFKAMKQGNEIKYLITVKPKNPTSFMFHTSCIELTKLQAKAMGIKQIFKQVSGQKEKEVEELKQIIASIADEIDGILTGAIASNYQKRRIDKIASQLGLQSIAPLWGISPAKYWKELLKNRFKVMIVSVASAGLAKELLGKIVDDKLLVNLISISKKYGFHLAFEGGEAETFVLDCPLFSQKIVIESYQIFWDSKTQSGYILPKKAFLAKK